MASRYRAPLTGVVFALDLTHDTNALMAMPIAVMVGHDFTVLLALPDLPRAGARTLDEDRWRERVLQTRMFLARQTRR